MMTLHFWQLKGEKTLKEPRVRVCGLLKKNNKILFVKHRKNDEEYYLLPGGGVDYGESFEVALKREYFEEVNIDISLGKMLFISEAIAPDQSKHIVNVYFEVFYKGGELVVAQEERLVGAEYLEIDKLDSYIIYPNVKKQIVDYTKNGQKNVLYLGNIWE